MGLSLIPTAIVYIAGIGKTVYQITKTPAGQKVIERLLAQGGRLLKGKPKNAKPTTVTAQNVAGVLKNLKKSNTGAGRPSPKKGSNVKKKNETIASGQQGPGGVTVRPPSAPKKPATQQGPGGVTVKPKPDKPPLRSSTKTKPRKPEASKPGTSPKKPKSPFAKETKAQTAARIKKEKIAAQRIKDNNKQNPSRDPRGKYQSRPLKPTNIPKTGGAKKGGLKSRLDAKAKRAAMGLGVAAVKADNLSRGEIEIGPRTPLPNKAKNPSAARKKPMQNKRSLKRKAPKPREIPVVKPKTGPMKVKPKKDESFGAAFKRNRAEKQPTFPWKDPKTGKTGKYTTRLKEESIADHKKKFGVTGKY